MTPEQAEWVREHAWTKTMRRTFADTPGHFLACPCQYGPCGHCDGGRHDQCAHRKYDPFPSPETYVTNAREQVLAVRGGFVHPSRSATGWHNDGHAMVWLADRRCVWVCPCCGTRPAQPVVLVSTRRRRRPDPEAQGALFERFETG